MSRNKVACTWCGGLPLKDYDALVRHDQQVHSRGEADEFRFREDDQIVRLVFEVDNPRNVINFIL